MMPSNWDDELKELKMAVTRRLNEAAKTIVLEEINKILGRVKIHISSDLQSGQFNWVIEQKGRADE